MSPGTLEAALRAAGGAVFAVDEVMGGKARNAFVSTRPPGHHAEVATADGLLLLQQRRHRRAARAEAPMAPSASRSWISTSITATAPSTSSGTIRPSCTPRPTRCRIIPAPARCSERGEHNQIVNAPLRAGDGGEAFREAMETAILPRLEAFAPDLVIISAGFDAHRRDPLGNLNLVEADFAWATRKLMGVARKHAHERVVSVLEGGYDLEGLSRSVAAHVTALMEG